MLFSKESTPHNSEESLTELFSMEILQAPALTGFL